MIITSAIFITPSLFKSYFLSYFGSPTTLLNLDAKSITSAILITLSPLKSPIAAGLVVGVGVFGLVGVGVFVGV
jgi:hypothetical protein